MARLLGFFGLILVLQVSCKKNTYVLKEDEMVVILTEIHLTEAILYQNVGRNKTKEDKLAYYNYVYEKYGVTKAQVDSSINYYSYYAPKFNDIYKRVVERLEKMDEEVELGQYLLAKELYFYDLSDVIQKADSAEKDSVITEIWKLKRNITLPNEGAKNTIAFSIDNDSSQNFSFIVLKADYELFFDDGSKDPAINLNVEYTDGKTDAIVLPLVKNGTQTPIRVRLPLDAKREVNRIYGELLGHDRCPKNKNARIRNIRLYKMDVPTIEEEMPDRVEEEPDTNTKDTTKLEADTLTMKLDTLDKKPAFRPLLKVKPVK